MGEYLDADLLKNRFTINLCSQTATFLGKPQTNFDATEWAGAAANAPPSANWPASWGGATVYPQGPNVPGVRLNNVCRWNLTYAAGYMPPPKNCKGVVVGLKSIHLGTAAGPTMVGSNYTSLSPLAPYHVVNVQLRNSGQRNSATKLQGADIPFQSGAGIPQMQQGDIGNNNNPALANYIPQVRTGQGILATLMTKPYNLGGAYVPQHYGPHPKSLDGSPYVSPWGNFDALSGDPGTTGGGRIHGDDGAGAVISGVLDYECKGDPCARGIFCGSSINTNNIEIALLDYNGREIKMGHTLQLIMVRNLSAVHCNPATVPANNQPWSISLVFQYIV